MNMKSTASTGIILTVFMALCVINDQLLLLLPAQGLHLRQKERWFKDIEHGVQPFEHIISKFISVDIHIGLTVKIHIHSATSDFTVISKSTDTGQKKCCGISLHKMAMLAF